MSASSSSSLRVSTLPVRRRERVPLTESTSSRLSTMRCSRSRSRSRMTIAVISLVIDAIGTTASLFLLITISPLSASCTSADEDRRKTGFTVSACAKPTVSARTKKRAQAATMPSSECSFLWGVAIRRILFFVCRFSLVGAYDLSGAWLYRSLDYASEKRQAESWGRRCYLMCAVNNARCRAEATGLLRFLPKPRWLAPAAAGGPTSWRIPLLLQVIDCGFRAPRRGRGGEIGRASCRERG